MDDDKLISGVPEFPDSTFEKSINGSQLPDFKFTPPPPPPPAQQKATDNNE